MFKFLKDRFLTKTSATTWLLIVAINFSAITYIKKWVDEDLNWYVITFDVATYYSYLPALFYGNIKTFPNYDSIKINHNNPYKCSEEYPTVFKLENGNRVIKTTFCMALMYTPAFVCGHIISSFTNQAQDGFTTPYQISMAYWFLLVSALGLWYLRKILLLYFNEISTAITLAIIALGTNYWFYVVDYGGMPHNFLFTLFAIALWHSIQFYNSKSKVALIIVAICSGLSFCCRPTEIMLLIPLIFWNISTLKDARARISFWLNHFKSLFLLASIYFLPFLIQMMYWKYTCDSWFFWSYKDEIFDFTKIHFAAYLWGSKKGWLYYTPVMILAIIGIVVALFKKIKNGPVIFIFLLITITISAAWHNWWYGGSFSQRSIIQSYVFLAIPISIVIQLILQSKKAIQFFLFTSITLLCLYNLMISTVCIRFYTDFNVMNSENSKILIRRSTIEYTKTMSDPGLTPINFYYYKFKN